LLLRFVDGFTECVSFLGGEGGSEGIKTRLRELSPVCQIGDGIRGSVIGSNSHALRGWLSSVELEDSDGGSIEIVGNSSDVLEFVVFDVM